MFLSSILLDVTDRLARADLRDIHQMHRTVMSGFDEADDARRRFAVLYRLEVPRIGVPRLLVQSAVEPNWSRLGSRVAFADAQGVQVKQWDPATMALRAGDRVRIRLVANATRQITDSNGKRMRVAHRLPARALDWLARQGQTAGFRLIPLEPDAGESGQQSMDVVTSLRMTGHRGQQRITIEAARFEGVVEVVDPDAMREAIVRGLGRGRAYGCGLLSVKPVPPH